MTGDSFHALVADPSGLNTASVALLQEVSARYPYFRTPRLLLARNLKEIDHIDQRRQLHLAAIYAADRSLLKDLLEGRHPTIRVAEPEQVRETRSEETVVHPMPSDVPEVQESTVKQPVEEPQSVDLSEDGSLATDTAAEEALNTPPVRHDFELIPEPLLYRVEDLLLTEPPSPAPSSPRSEPEALTFSEWLEQIGSGKVTPDGNAPNDPTEITVSHARQPAKDNMALIADFLASQPTDGRSQRAEFFKASKASERSNTLDLTAVSETLANIYLQQGQYELAIKAFDALARKYPDKSSYFAARQKEALQRLGAP